MKVDSDTFFNHPDRFEIYNGDVDIIPTDTAYSFVPKDKFNRDNIKLAQELIRDKLNC